jgi:type IV pilus assembly protein PilN
MIRINLLPFRAERKKENIRRQISVYFLSVLLLLLISGYLFLDLIMTQSDLENEAESKRQELATYAAVTKELKEIENKIKELESKLTVIRGLEKAKTGPVRLLDEIADAVPRERLWLSLISDKKGILTIGGTAMDNDTVALFMTNLEKAEHIVSVDLDSTKLRELKEFKLSVSEFILKCQTYAYEVPKKAAPAKKAQPRTRKQS